MGTPDAGVVAEGRRRGRRRRHDGGGTEALWRRGEGGAVEGCGAAPALDLIRTGGERGVGEERIR